MSERTATAEVEVAADPARAFDAFTSEIDAWWVRGAINFFDAEFHDHGHGMMAEALGENFYSFDVTRVLQAIARSGDRSASGALQLSFVPGGSVNPNARPLVATIELVRQ